MFRTSVILTLSFLTSVAAADVVQIGNEVARTDWNRSLAAVRVYDPSISDFRMIDSAESTGPMVSIDGVTSAPDGLLSASSFVDGYDLSGGITTFAAPQEFRVTTQLRDQIYVEAEMDADSILEFEFSIDYAATISGYADFQFTLFSKTPADSFLLLDDVRSVDFELVDGESIDTSRNFTLSTAMAEFTDDVRITSGTYVPLQFSLTGIVQGSTNLDYLNTLELTGFNVLDANGDPLDAVTSSAQAPANSLLNTNPVPEPSEHSSQHSHY